MTNDEMKILTQRLDQIQDSVNRVDKDLEQDRRELQEVMLRLGAVEGELRQLKDDITRMPRKVSDKVDDAVKPVSKEAHDLKKVLQGMRVLRLPIKKNGWKFWKKGG